MDPLTLSMITMGVGGAVKVAGDIFGANSASSQADLMRQQANLKLGALEETERRAEGQQTQVLSSTKARMAASGFEMDSGSFKDYLTSMATEFQNQNQTTQQQGMASIDLMRKAADTEGDPTRFILQGVGDMFGTAAGMTKTAFPGGGV